MELAITLENTRATMRFQSVTFEGAQQGYSSPNIFLPPLRRDIKEDKA